MVAGQKSKGRFVPLGIKPGQNPVRRAVSFAANNGIEALTLYAFSSENWNRPAQEVSALMELFVWALDSEVKSLHRHNVRLRIIGDTSRFNSRLQERIRNLKSANSREYRSDAEYCGELRWTLGYSPGVRQLAEKVQQGNLQPDQIDEEMLNQHVCMHELAPVDLVIRTGGASH